MRIKKLTTFMLCMFAFSGFSRDVLAGGDASDACIPDCADNASLTKNASLKSLIIAAISQSPQLAEIQAVLNVDNARIDEKKAHGCRRYL